MKVANFFALLAALLLTVGEFLVIDYDARQQVVRYQAEAASALTPPVAWPDAAPSGAASASVHILGTRYARAHRGAAFLWRAGRTRRVGADMTKAQVARDGREVRARSGHADVAIRSTEEKAEPQQLRWARSARQARG